MSAHATSPKDSPAPPLLQVRSLGVRYDIRGGFLRRPLALQAIESVDFELAAGETLGVVGESGCGKSTLARAILQLVPASAGEVSWCGRSLAALPAEALRALRAQIQVIFQDPRGSLDPRMTVGDIVAEPLTVFQPHLDARGRDARVARMLERVGLPPVVRNRYPHEFSGGQCQRIGIARALILEPRLLVCDEPVNALDVSVQAQIVNLLRRLQRELGLAMLFVSHNLAIVRHVSRRILVLYLGRTMEIGPRDALFARPLHPYTRALLASIPRVEPESLRTREGSSMGGEVPSAIDPPTGCVFHTRCPWVQRRCVEQRPPLERTPDDRWVACHRWRELPVARYTGADTGHHESAQT